MNMIFIILAFAALPLILLTMYSRTSDGRKVKLGSFFIIRKYRPDFLKIRTFKEIIILILRLLCAGLIILLIYDPLQVKVPEGKALLHEPEQSKTDRYKYSMNYIAPVRAVDSYDEDNFFLESFIKSKRSSQGNIDIIYNPTESIIDKSGNDIIIFPSRKQAGNAFLKWIDLIDFASIRAADLKIKGTDIKIRNYYPLLVKNIDVVKYAELENGSVIAAAFSDNGRRVLIFGTGISGFWGDLGTSGYFIDIIDSFISNAALKDNTEKKLSAPSQAEVGEVKSFLSFDLILKIACIFFLIELIVFIIKSLRLKKTLLISLFIFFSTGLFAEDFKFIELNFSNMPSDNSKIFLNIKRELEKVTSIRISTEYYKTLQADQLVNGGFPEFPFLWITEFKYQGNKPQKLEDALLRFIQKGGIIFVNLHNADERSRSFFRALGKKIAIQSEIVQEIAPENGKRTIGISPLPQDHPVYKSFYLISGKLEGADISATTRRTALIVCEDDLLQKIFMHDSQAIKTGVNIVLYMLSGNYKSDQIHTRQILNRLKRRELFK